MTQLAQSNGPGSMAQRIYQMEHEKISAAQISGHEWLPNQIGKCCSCGESCHTPSSTRDPDGDCLKWHRAHLASVAQPAQPQEVLAPIEACIQVLAGLYSEEWAAGNESELLKLAIQRVKALRKKYLPAAQEVPAEQRDWHERLNGILEGEDSEEMQLQSLHGLVDEILVAQPASAAQPPAEKLEGAVKISDRWFSARHERADRETLCDIGDEMRDKIRALIAEQRGK